MDVPGYRVIRELGRGGMATVYLALQESLQRHVALKVMSAELARDADFRGRFLREAQLVARLVHPHIVTVHDFGSAGDLYFLSMEYLPGGTLKERIGRGLPPAQATEILAPVAKALAHAHRQGVVHRDIKPQNIMFRDDGSPVLTDFGIARLLTSDTQLTATGVTIGSPRYMSPEQVMGQPVDGRSDLFSLGIVLYEMLTGAVPWVDTDHPITMALKLCSEPVPPLPAGLARYQGVLDRLVAKQPAERYPDADALAAELQRLAQAEQAAAAADATVLYVPRPTAGRAGERPGRGGRKVVLGVAGALVLAGLGAALYLASDRLPDQRETAVGDEAEKKRLDAERLEAERLAAEQKRLEAERLGAEQKRREAERLTAEQKRLEAERLAAEQKRLEAERLVAEQKRREAERLTAEQKRLEAERLAAEKERLDAERLEAEQLAAEQKRIEADRLAAEQERLEAERLAAEQKRLEAERQAAEKKRLEAERLAAEKKRLEAERLEAERLAAEQKRIEAERLAAEQKRIEAERLAAEQKRIEAERQAAEQKRLDAERQAAEQKRLEAERQTAEQKRLEAERLAAEQRRIETEARISRLLAQCEDHLRAGRLTTGSPGTAHACYKEVLALQPNNPAATAGIGRIADQYATLASEAVDNRNPTAGNTFLERLQSVDPQHGQLAVLRQRMEQAEREIEQSVAAKQKQRELAKRAPEPASQARPAAGPGRSQCRDLLMRLQLGEPLSASDQKVLREDCR